MLQSGDFVLCTVIKIVGTTIFVKTEKGEEGTIITSEIAPGRIRNLRDYVVPNKKIVCKVLKAEGNQLYLSLRRVSTKEKKEVMEKYKQDKTVLSILKTVLGEKAEQIANKIKTKTNLHEFFQSCKTNPAELEKYTSKEEADKICKILSEKKESKKQVKKEFKLISSAPNGIKLIKQILSQCSCEITYLGSGKYTIKITSETLKQADKEISSALENIEKQAKSAKADFMLIKK